MTRVAIDASALIAFLGREAGGETVTPYLLGSIISSVNYSEVIQKILSIGGDLEGLHRTVLTFGIGVVPFDAEAARRTAELAAKTARWGLSLADRACIALGLAEGLPVLTADRMWRKLKLGEEIIMIRGAEH